MCYLTMLITELDLKQTLPHTNMLDHVVKTEWILITPIFVGSLLKNFFFHFSHWRQYFFFMKKKSVYSTLKNFKEFLTV